MVVQPESIHYSAKLPDLPWIQYIKLTKNILVRVRVLIPPSVDTIYLTVIFFHTNVLRLGRCQLPHLCICQSISVKAPWLSVCSGDQGTVALLHN